MFKQNLVGAPVIVYNRYQAVGETNIRGNPYFKCRKIEGLDANSLFISCLSQNLFTGDYIHRKESTNFKPEQSGRYTAMFDWLEYLNHMGANVSHKQNSGKEHRIGPYFIDGIDFNTNTIYEYMGCYWHGDDCYLTKHVKDKKLLETRRKNTEERIDFLRSCGYTVVVMKECEMKNKLKSDANLSAFVDTRKPFFFKSIKMKFLLVKY